MLEKGLTRGVGSTVSRKTNLFNTDISDGSVFVHLEYQTSTINKTTLKSLVLSQGRNLRTTTSVGVRTSVGSTTWNKSTVFNADKESPSIVCWQETPVKEWNQTFTMCWVMYILQKHNIKHQDIRLSNFNINGKNLIKMSKDDFISLEKEHGQLLYEELRKKIGTHETSHDKKTDTVRKPRGRGRPSKGGSRKNKEKGGRMVWEFLIDLLKNDKTEELISWKDQNQGIFKFESSAKVAQKWGERKKNDKMNFEKMSRAMRYHYKSKILMPVEGERLVYRFGPGLDLETGKPVITDMPSTATDDSSDLTDS